MRKYYISHIDFSEIVNVTTDPAQLETARRRMKELGLTIRERKMADGGRLIIAVDDLTRFSGHVDGFQYRECFAVRLGPTGERAGRDGDINALDWYKRWYSTGAGIENYIADDIKRSEKK